MNILLVDDDVDIIEAMVDAIDFKALGFNNIYIAHGGEEAINFLRTMPINIMITDIEMPDKSGLELLEWVRDNSLPIVSIFCTCYADFNYAKKAVELQSFDYFLKPIAYSELTERIILAIKEVKRVRELKEYKEYLSNFNNHTVESKNKFWKEQLNSTSSLKNLLIKYPESEIDLESKYLIIIAYYFDNEPMICDWKNYGSKNIFFEVLDQDIRLEKEAVISLFNDTDLIIYKENITYRREMLENQLDRITKLLSQHVQTNVCLYYYDGCILEGISKRYFELKKIFGNDVMRKKPITNGETYIYPEYSYSPSYINDVELLITAGNCKDAMSKINEYLADLSERSQLNRELLKTIRIDIMQLIHTLLKSKGINAHTLYSSSTFDSLREHSLASVNTMQLYLNFIIMTAGEYFREEKNSASVIDTVADYIDKHLDEELSRNALSGMVFLNPDYLARQFKKEKGISIGNYILGARINRAKMLLLQTDLTINEISQKIGYDNFSYFSHIFREKTGTTPNEFRRKYL